MTYSTPELLLVGAAQNLVLGETSIEGGCRKLGDNGVPPFSNHAELW